MSAPLDMDIFKLFLADLDDTDMAELSIFAAPTFHSVDSRRRGDMLYLIHAMVLGSWCDFHDEDDSPTRFIDTNNFLDTLPCRPLLEPWLTNGAWELQEIIALRVTYELSPKP